MKHVTCMQCGWVHIAVNQKQANAEGWGNVPKECFSCGAPHTQMCPAKEDDCPDGCTLQPILG